MTKSLISKMKYAKTEMTKHYTKKSIITTITSVTAATVFGTMSVIDVFGAYDVNSNPQTEVVTVTVVTERTMEISRPASYSPQPQTAAITESIEEIVEGYEVYVDGKLVGIVSQRGKDKIDTYVEELVASVDSKGEVKLCQELTYEKGFFNGVDVVTSNTILSQVELEVMEIVKETAKEVIPFETVYVDSDEVAKGESIVQTEGVDGLKVTKSKVIYKNGKEISREILSEKETAPVNKVVLNGTKSIANLTASQIEAVGGVAFPLGNASYYVSSQFGYRTFDNSFHDGIDYAANFGTPVYSAMSGKVIFAGWDNTGYGNYVVVEHANGYVTGYAHLAEIVVSKGDTVEAGQCVGAVGSTGYSTGNHLHFSIRVNGEFTNPAAFF